MRWGIAAVACAVVLAVPPSPAHGEAGNGQLVAIVDNRLVTLNADGSGLRTLWVPPEGGEITGPAWSPDGNRIAFSHAGRIVVVDVVAGRGVTIAGTGRDVNPTWRADGGRLAFRRIAAGTQQQITVTREGGDPRAAALPSGTNEIAWAPDLERTVLALPGVLRLGSLELTVEVHGPPAWAPVDDRIAFARRDGSLATVAFGGGQVTPVPGASPAGPPRWSPDGAMLAYAVDGRLRTVPAGGGEPRVVPVAGSVTAADWQPCTSATVRCESIAPPRCSATAAAATTQVDQPVDLPAPPCADPAGRPLSIVVVKPPDRGTLDGLRYTPAPGFTGQDVVTYRLSNGAGESEVVRVTIFVVPRPVPVQVAAPAARRAPFLSARGAPRLDRRLRTRARLSCDQACSISVRLTARLRSRRTLRGPVVRRPLAAGDVVTVRLQLPRRPRSRLKTVWITGRVRNAAGDVRAVKLPVDLRG